MRTCSRVASLVVLTVGAVVAARPAQAQLPQPRLQGIFPMGVRAGSTADVTLRGTDLEGVNALWFDHPGLRAFHLKGATFRVACASGTPVGHHDVRAVGTFGVSNPRTLVVGERPETLEVEPNNTPAQSTPIARNSVVYGELAATDLDHFAFEGKAGDRVFLDLEAERVESRLDATLRVFDPAGREIDESRDVFGADPFLDLTLPVDGRYVVKVHDVIYGGSTEHTYRLTLHDGPHLDAVVPTVAAAGVPTKFTLLGRNLGGTPAPGLSIGGLPVEQREVTLTMPRTMEPDPALPTLGFLPSSAASRRGLEFSLPGPSGPSNPVFIAEAVDPIVLDREPNDAEHPQAVTLPCDVSGSFATPGDTDVYRFQGRKGDVWWIEVDAERIGSPADPVFLVQKVVEKGAPQDLVAGEDLPDPGGAARFNMATLDAAVRWQVPEDGVYQVVVNDLYGSQRGDPRLSYRLNIRPERPDFQLFVVPDDALALDSLTVRAGGRASAYVLARRSDGFAGPIFVEARDLPPGVRCDPVVIAAGQVLAPLVFEADEDARPHVGTALLVGRARRGDRKEDLAYVAGATPLGPDRTHPALAGGMIHPPAAAAVAGTVPVIPARVLRGFVLAVREAAPLALSATPRTLVVAQGHQLNLDVSVTRRAGFVEPVVVTATRHPGQPDERQPHDRQGGDDGRPPPVRGEDRGPRLVHLRAPGDRPVPVRQGPECQEEGERHADRTLEPDHADRAPGPGGPRREREGRGPETGGADRGGRDDHPAERVRRRRHVDPGRPGRGEALGRPRVDSRRPDDGQARGPRGGGQPRRGGRGGRGPRHRCRPRRAGRGRRAAGPDHFQVDEASER